MTRIGFAGLTHLGLCSAVAAASKGYGVVGWHDDAALVERIENGELPVEEPDLERLLAENRDRISFSADVSALAACDVVFVAFDVPTDDAGRSDLAPIDKILHEIAPVLGPEATLVVLCQVPPGFTRAHVQLHPRLYYQVETLIFGQAMARATTPERIIVGLEDASSALPPLYRGFLESFACPVLPMRFESAELCKIAINCFLVASVSTTNALAELCECIDANWSEIAPALRLDRRIGPHAYLKPGLGISGGNLERDLATVVRIAESRSSDAGVIDEYRRYSDVAKDWPTRMLERELDGKIQDRGIAVLGLAYKENTHSTKNSPALRLIANISSARISVYDPIVPASVAPDAKGCVSAMAAVTDADAVLLMTPWDEFRKLVPAQVAKAMAGSIVIDPYELWESSAVAAAGLHHIVRGRAPSRT